ncbi:MAG TPA: OmpA family protein [Methylomirabilota bacterium]|jgi:outer membrane protein OmpA-like peptidoglycan-associated protein
MPLLGRISFVLGATAVTLLAVGCAARHEPAPTVAAVAAPPAASATPLLAPTWPDAAPVPEASAPDAAGPAPDPERIAEFAPREELKDVHFASGHIQVERRDLASLDAAVAWLKSNPSQLVILEGYTDAVGARAANLALAHRRATWVMQYLVGHGIPESRITVVSRGEDGTRCADRRTACQSRNRRVHFLVRESETVQISASPSH